MKNNKFLVALLVVLIAIAVYLFITNKSETVSEMEGAKSDFAIEDTAAIDKIFIADSKGQKVTLEKNNGTWMVDGKYVARPDNIRLLMKTFNRIEVQSPVPKAAMNNTIRNIATGGTKVEIYQGKKKPTKTYYVGGPTLTHQGTYMVLETEGVKSTVPFIMHIPGFYGYLTTRFFTESEQWRDAVVFKYATEDIKSIKVDYPETPKQSFVIENNEGNYELKDYESKLVGDADPEIIQQYITFYEGIYYEMIDVESTQEKKDSIIATQPYFTIEVEGVIGGKNKIVAYHMPNYRQSIDSKTEEPYQYDVDRMYALLNDELFVFIQFATFDQIKLPKAFFIKR